MRRLLVIVAVLGMLGVSVAQASTITVDAVRTVYNGSLDKLNIYLTGYEAGSGIDPGTVMRALNGTWSIVESGKGLALYTDSEEGTWIGNTTTLGKQAGFSYIRYDATIDNAPPAPTLWSRTSIGVTDMYSQVTGQWYTTAGSTYQTTPTTSHATSGLFAVMYVSTGANVQYTGQVALSSSLTPYSASFTTATPEPGTVVLLASGLVGLLIAAWRRKR